ncbi:MAG: ArsR family transcriptional regulator [Candidatus Acididesulfobacter guangdongensis]|uniref:ArsR family transcriptional regulator n=1 Tax=Acididesulfobacter guangdongensis TaxID=2597225 RepID=A0A519BEJ5_ACIG2|nr:MAG: ArsR family transcriptional regulator [Candidatus Acididesulfobacter guangdongensis]
MADITEKISQIFKLLSDTNRVKILFSLESGSRTVSQIIETTGMSQPLVSFHLRVLREAGLIKTSRKSTFVFNELCDDELINLISKFEKYGGDNKQNTVSKFQCQCN